MMLKKVKFLKDYTKCKKGEVKEYDAHHAGMLVNAKVAAYYVEEHDDTPHELKIKQLTADNKKLKAEVAKLKKAITDSKKAK